MKRAIKLALRQGADIIIDLHPDFEYKPTSIPAALVKIRQGADFVLGNRFEPWLAPLASGMHIWKFVPISILNFICKLVFGSRISDYHQGFRVYTRHLLNEVNFEINSNDYLFSLELIAQAVFGKLKIEQVPVEVNYTGKRRGASLINSIKYSLGTFKVIGLYLLAKLGTRVKLFLK